MRVKVGERVGAINERVYARGWRIGCLLFAALLPACTTTTPPPSQPAPGQSKPAPPPATRSLPNVNLSGYPPAFREGFRDGCDSFRGNYRRDGTRFNKDNDYTIGWQDGFSICRRQGK
jgi:hypothetical protein